MPACLSAWLPMRMKMSFITRLHVYPFLVSCCIQMRQRRCCHTLSTWITNLSMLWHARKATGPAYSFSCMILADWTSPHARASHILHIHTNKHTSGSSWNHDQRALSKDLPSNRLDQIAFWHTRIPKLPSLNGSFSKNIRLVNDTVTLTTMWVRVQRYAWPAWESRKLPVLPATCPLNVKRTNPNLRTLDKITIPRLQPQVPSHNVTRYFC